MGLEILYPPDKLIGTVLHRFEANIPVNPPKIVLFDGDDITIDMNNMESLQPCIISFMDSRYVVWKNQDGALVMEEVE